MRHLIQIVALQLAGQLVDMLVVGLVIGGGLASPRRLLGKNRRRGVSNTRSTAGERLVRFLPDQMEPFERLSLRKPVLDDAEEFLSTVVATPAPRAIWTGSTRGRFRGRLPPILMRLARSLASRGA